MGLRAYQMTVSIEYVLNGMEGCGSCFMFFFHVCACRHLWEGGGKEDGACYGRGRVLPSWNIGGARVSLHSHWFGSVTGVRYVAFSQPSPCCTHRLVVYVRVSFLLRLRFATEFFKYLRNQVLVGVDRSVWLCVRCACVCLLIPLCVFFKFVRFLYLLFRKYESY